MVPIHGNHLLLILSCPSMQVLRTRTSMRGLHMFKDDWRVPKLWNGCWKQAESTDEHGGLATWFYWFEFISSPLRLKSFEEACDSSIHRLLIILNLRKGFSGSKSTRNNAQQLIVHSVIREQPNILSHGHQSITFFVISWSQEGHREWSEVKNTHDVIILGAISLCHGRLPPWNRGAPRSFCWKNGLLKDPSIINIMWTYHWKADWILYLAQRCPCAICFRVIQYGRKNIDFNHSRSLFSLNMVIFNLDRK